jgi:diaminopimelate decarboxylase
MTLALSPEATGTMPGPFSVWPGSARPAPSGDVSVGGVSLAEAADRFGTPLYVLDEHEVRERCRTYRAAFGSTLSLRQGRTIGS